MAEVDLSKAVPKEAQWIKVHYEIKPKKPGADLIARIWSGEQIDEDTVVIKGPSGDAFVKMKIPQKLYYEFPVTVDLSLKVTAYKSGPLDS